MRLSSDWRVVTARRRGLRPGRISNGVLACELVGDLRVDAVEVLDLGREEGAAAGFLRELAQDELGLAESARLRVGAAQGDGVDGGFGALREVEHLIEGDEARRVFAVGEDDDGLSPHVFFAARLDLSQFLERDVDGVVQRGRSAGRGLEDCRLEIRVDWT